MPTKIFTVMGGQCPFGRGCEIDSATCRKCEWFYRIGTATFFWCNHPVKVNAPSDVPLDAPPMRKRIARKVPKLDPPKKKRGRPAKKSQKRPVTARKTKKG